MVFWRLEAICLSDVCTSRGTSNSKVLLLLVWRRGGLPRSMAPMFKRACGREEALCAGSIFVSHLS
eukprot:2511302-Amphidinium_carterae.3